MGEKPRVVGAVGLWTKSSWPLFSALQLMFSWIRSMIGLTGRPLSQLVVTIPHLSFTYRKPLIGSSAGSRPLIFLALAEH
jgi:hypothetical protein